MAETYISFLPLFKKIVKIRKIEKYLEWGCGLYSTPLASNYIGKDNVYSIENDKDWCEKIRSLGYNIHLKHLYKGAHCEYVAFPMTLKIKFDFIFVDGRNRILCMHEAKSLLNNNGIVMLHDIHREKYLEGIKGLFKYEHIDTELDTGIFSDTDKLGFLC